MRLETKLLAAFVLLAAPACSKSDAPDPASMTPEERGGAEFRRVCSVCHTVGDPSAPGAPRLVGPSLFGVYGAPAARQEGFDYSPAMRDAGLVWDDATLSAFIENPHMVVPKTRMSFAGESDAQKRADIIAYLKTAK